MLTIAYFTSRVDPHIEWFFRTLARECRGCATTLDLLIVDYLSQYRPEERQVYLRDRFAETFAGKEKEYGIRRLQILSPKPSAWQGKWKCTDRDYFAASDARNTAFIHCETPYIVCIDDLCALERGWMKVALWGMRHAYTVLGAYKKVENLTCDAASGDISFKRIVHVDNRYNDPGDDFAFRVPGKHLYSCIFGLPLHLALEVDGFDTAYNGQGGEDVDLGIRLQKITDDIFYSRRFLIYEDEHAHFRPGNRKLASVPKYCRQSDNMDGYLLEMAMRRKTPSPRKKNNLRKERKHYRQHGRYMRYDFRDEINWRTGNKICDDL